MIMTYLIWALPVLGILFFVFIKRVPHGWVQWRTGLGLKFLPSLDHLSPVEMRNKIEKFSLRGLERTKKKLPVASVVDLEIPTRHGPILARIYDDSADASKAPIVYMHGGGFCFGSRDLFEEQCRRLAKTCNRKVFSLEYSLSPEHKFPRAHQECEDAARWISEQHVNLGNQSEQIVLMGDSAGGNLAISTAFEMRKKGENHLIANLIPIYPSLEGYPNTTNSLKNYGKGYFLSAQSMASFTDALVSTEEDKEDPRLKLAHVQELENFPPTFILNAEFDPLRDDGERFEKRLLALGNQVQRKVYKGTTHAFFGIGIMGDQGVKAIRDIVRYLKQY